MNQQYPNPHPPTFPKAVSFFDGQNLFYSAKRAFGYGYLNYDPKKLAQQICDNQGWQLVGVQFYTGIPDATDHRSYFWRAKFNQMKRDGVIVFSRELRYQEEEVLLPDGQTHLVRVGKEKGIDVRIAIDVIRLAHQKVYDVAIIFSQDQDLSEVAKEIRIIAQEQARWIKIASAFPCASNPCVSRGINQTDWIRIYKPTYDLCIDLRDYRPKKPPSTP